METAVFYPPVPKSGELNHHSYLSVSKDGSIHTFYFENDRIIWNTQTDLVLDAPARTLKTGAAAFLILLENHPQIGAVVFHPNGKRADATVFYRDKQKILILKCYSSKFTKESMAEKIEINLAGPAMQAHFNLTKDSLTECSPNGSAALIPAHSIMRLEDTDTHTLFLSFWLKNGYYFLSIPEMYYNQDRLAHGFWNNEIFSTPGYYRECPETIPEKNATEPLPSSKETHSDSVTQAPEKLQQAQENISSEPAAQIVPVYHPKQKDQTGFKKVIHRIQSWLLRKRKK